MPKTPEGVPGGSDDKWEIPSGSEGAHEIVCFPVTKKTCKIAQREIAKNPLGAHIQEVEGMKRNNNVLFHSLAYLREGTPFEPRIVIEGEASTYRILRVQAERRGLRLPEVTAEHLNGHMQDSREDIDRLDIDSIGIEDYVTTQMQQLSSSEKKLGNAIHKMLRYSTRRPDFHYGAVNVYQLIRKAVEAQEWRDKFKS